MTTAAIMRTYVLHEHAFPVKAGRCRRVEAHGQVL
jgi:hypothetical protein